MTVSDSRAPPGEALRAHGGRTEACPEFISAFMAAYVRQRGAPTESVVGLWAHTGEWLRVMVEALAPNSAIGVVPPGVVPPGFPDRDSGANGVRRCETDSPLAFLDELEGELDVVVGIPGSHWHPYRVALMNTGDPVIVCDDPDHVAIVEACRRLAPDGVGLFIVAPGFVLRPGPQTALPTLARFGVRPEAIVQLPRGIFRPDTGTGRWLVALSHRPATEVLAGHLTAEPASAASLIARMPCGTRRHVAARGSAQS